MELEKLFEKIYTPVAPLTGKCYASDEPLDYAKRESGTPIDVDGDTKWTDRRFGCGWFHLTGSIPDDCRGRHVVLLIDLGGEACAYTPDGVPLKGFTNVKSEFTIALGKPAKQVLWDVSPFEKDGNIDIWLDAGANDLFGNFIDGGRTQKMCIAVCNDEMRKLYYDAEIMTLADDIFKAAFEALPDGDMKGLSELTERFFSMTDGNGKTVIAEGHAHIDLAWLWPVRETRRKALRTFSTLLYNAALYPEYVFGASQPQLLEWLKTDSPEIFEGIKKLHRDGRFETQGMFWVECDANMPSGESLVRQAIYGDRFWKSEFGCSSDICWLPDSFGFNAQLPQIIRKTGGRYFLTTKLSWNDVNAFPYSSFIWRGIDGSEVVSHIPPEGNYNSAASPASLKAVVSNKSNVQTPYSMMLFGIGDGGGGPGMEHLERLEREHSLKGLPKVHQGKSAELFERLEEYKDSLPMHSGELYLEKHQGTYTTHGRVKAFNAECERRLTAAEALLAVVCADGGEVPRDALNSLWKQILFLQFHDILPGSAISRVYIEAEAQYENILAGISSVTPKGASLFNATSFARTEYALRDGKAVCIKALPFASADVSDCEDKGVYSDKTMLESDLLKVCFDYDGSIISIFDKEHGVELLRDRATLAFYPDEENAWEVGSHKPSEAKKPVLTELDCEEGVIATMHQTYSCGESVIKCDISLIKDSRRIEFDIDLDLKDEKCCVRWNFPLCVRSDEAVCGIPFGSVRRPTHSRDSIAGAMKEVCCRHFVDISDGENGFALMSGEKFGYDIKNCILSINLVRNSTCPRDVPPTDTGSHRIRFAAYVHSGDSGNGVVREAELFANPLIAGMAYTQSIAAVSDGNIVIEAIKPAEAGNGAVLRLYESGGSARRCTLKLHPSLAGRRLYVADMLENIIGETGNELEFGAFEVKTIIAR